MRAWKRMYNFIILKEYAGLSLLKFRSGDKLLQDHLKTGPRNATIFKMKLPA